MNKTRIPSPRRLAVGLVIASALTVPMVATSASASTGAAAAQPAPATAGQEQLAERVRLLCERVPLVLRRANSMLDRILGDAETVGSLAWLDARIARAEAAGRDDLVVVLQNRRDAREGMIPILQRHIARLEQILARCEDLQAGQ